MIQITSDKRKDVMMWTNYRSIFHCFLAIAKRPFCSACLLAAVLPAASGQTRTASKTDPQSGRAYNATFTFDVASIREVKPTGVQSIRVENSPRSGVYIGTNIKVAFLISAAYGIDGHFISDKSEWASSAIFDVSAKSDASVDEALAKLSEDDAELEKQHMLQALLLDRFKFSAHKETRVTGVYELRLSNANPKLR